MSTAATAGTKPPIPVRATASHFYKYGSLAGSNQLERLKTVIHEHLIYAPTLTELKDPADGRPRLAQLTEDQLFSFLYDGRYGVLGRNQQLPIEDQILAGAILDVNIRHHGGDTINRKLSEVLNAELKGWKVYCLAQSYDSMSMWENYADNHRGYCLEFANEGPFFGSAMQVTYGESMELDITNIEHLSGWWFFCKRQEYSFENEVRVLVPRHLPQVTRIDPKHLTRIILGRSVSNEHATQIREWAKEREPRLQVVTASWDAYKQKLDLIP